MRHGELHLVKVHAVWIAVTFLLIILPSEIQAQQGPPPGQGSPAVVNPKIDAREQEIRESRLRSAELGVPGDDLRRQQLEATIVQLKEDFTRIQVLRNKIARGLVARIPLDYQLVSDQTGEIHKRAEHLKLYLVPAASDDKEEKKEFAEADGQDMISALVRLCKLIDGFVENPVLKNAATVDASNLDKVKGDKARAATDLINIIELSGRIRQDAQRLDKH